MFYTYILISGKTGKYYIGSTNNVANRLKRHNQGYIRSTKAYRPWKLLYTEKYQTLGKARARENQVKNWTSRDAIEKLISAPFV